MAIRSQQYSGVSASSGELAIGDSVRCQHAEPARGTWSRFAAKLGTIVTINRRRFDNGAPDHVEIGVSFDNTHNVAAWFLPSELVVVESTVIQAAERPSRRRKPCPCPNGADCRIARQADGGHSHRRKWKRLAAAAAEAST